MKINRIRINWTVVLEATRLYILLLEDMIKCYEPYRDKSKTDKENYDYYLGQKKIYIERLDLIYRYGPVIKEFYIKELPHIYHECKNEQEIKKVNIDLQQSFFLVKL